MADRTRLWSQGRFLAQLGRKYYNKIIKHLGIPSVTGSKNKNAEFVHGLWILVGLFARHGITMINQTII